MINWPGRSIASPSSLGLLLSTMVYLWSMRSPPATVPFEDDDCFADKCLRHSSISLPCPDSLYAAERNVCDTGRARMLRLLALELFLTS